MPTHSAWVCSRIGLGGSLVGTKPARWLVTLCLTAAALAMAGGVYFSGTGRMPLGMLGTLLFVVLGGLGFELARRRSV